MALSQYTEIMVSGLVHNGDWGRISDEDKKKFILNCEKLASAAALAKQMGTDALVFDVDGVDIIPTPIQLKKDRGSEKARSEKTNAKSEPEQRQESKAATTVNNDVVKPEAEPSEESELKELMGCLKKGSETEKMVKAVVSKGKPLSDKDKERISSMMLKEVMRDQKPSNKTEEMALKLTVRGFVGELGSMIEGAALKKAAESDKKEDESKPQSKTPSNGAIVNEFARTAMHMTWDALRKAGVEADKLKDFTKGYIDSFREKSETVLDKLYGPKQVKDPKVDGPRPEPVTEVEKAVVATDGMEAELAAAVQDKARQIGQKAAAAAQEAMQSAVLEAIHQEPESKAASTMSGIVGNFVKPADPTPTTVPAAMANPAIRQVAQPIQTQQQTVLIPVKQSPMIPLPDNWNQMSSVDKCFYLEQFVGVNGLPEVYNPRPELDELGQAKELRSHIVFAVNGLIHPIQVKGLLQLIGGPKLAAKMSALGAADAGGEPHMTEVPVQYYASNKAGKYDMAFVMPCNDPGFQILILFSSVPELRDGGWAFDSSIEKVKTKKQRKHHDAAPVQQVTSEATMPASSMSNAVKTPRQSGLGMGVTLGDVLRTQKAQPM